MIVRGALRALSHCERVRSHVRSEVNLDGRAAIRDGLCSRPARGQSKQVIGPLERMPDFFQTGAAATMHHLWRYRVERFCDSNSRVSPYSEKTDWGMKTLIH